MLTSSDKISAVMGLNPLAHSLAELDARVAAGLPKSALVACVSRVCASSALRQDVLRRIVSARTFKRRVDKLSPLESARTERLARTFAIAAYVWNSDAEARAFLVAPHPMLQGRSPLDVSMSELGAMRVEALLGQLHFGVLA